MKFIRLVNKKEVPSGSRSSCLRLALSCKKYHVYKSYQSSNAQYSGLSATIGSPEIFNNWLESVQTSHGFKHAFIQHPHRYSHLRKFFYIIDNQVNEFSSLSQHKNTARTRFIHPIGALSFGRTTIPDDLALESGDTLSLYRALVSVEAKSGLDLKPLDPSVFFAKRKELLRQKDILEYEAHLKSAVATLLDRNDRRDPAGNVGLEVVARVQDPVLSKFGSRLDVAPTRKAFKDNLIQLLGDLHVQNQLVGRHLPTLEN